MRKTRLLNHLVIILIVAITTVCSASSSKPIANDTSWKIMVAPIDEPGERIVVSGTVFDDDGKSTLEGASVYVYHTDIRGYYSGETTNNTNPRLHGTMRTSKDGKYEFETIKPGPYPAARVPAHIHYVVNAPGHKEKIFEIVFEGDEFINERIRQDARNEDGMFAITQLAKNQEGMLSCVQNIKMRRQ